MPRRTFEPPLLTLAIIGLILYFGVAFLSPLLDGADRVDEEAHDSPAITKRQAAEAALQFAGTRFRLSADTDTSTLYQSYTARSGYLQKEHLFDDYVKQYGDRFPLDYYEVEINDRSTGLNYFIAVNYKTKAIISFERNKSAAAKTDTVSSVQTNPDKLAEQAMKEMGYNPAEFVRKSGGSKPGEGITYESTTMKIGEARLVLVMIIADGQVTAFRPAFTVPQSFIAWQEAQDNRSAMMTRISMLTSLAMALAAIWIVIRYRRQIRFTNGLILTLVFLAVYIANNFNMMPAFRTAHGSGPTEANAVIYLWIVNIFVILLGLSTYFSLAAGKYVWQGKGWNPWPVWRDPSFGNELRTAMIRGYLICLFILGLQQVMFLIAGEAFDVWAVSDPADSVYNMLYPAVFPLMAWAAAISEEAVYRLFGVAVFLKLTRSRFLAVLIPSIIWAMSHTQYPIYPVYTRLVEVSVIGLLFGWAFLRYGFLTAVFAHAAMDSILMGLSLMYMGEPLQIAAGGIYLVLPAFVGWLLSWLHGRFKHQPPPFPRLPRPAHPQTDPDSGRLTPL